MDMPLIQGYTPVRPLGAGGFARVYLYDQDFPRRKVALKVMNERLSIELQQAFFNEVNILASLSAHPHIVNLYNAGLTIDGRPYLTLELGVQTLADYIRNALFSVEQAVDIALKLASALSFAHSQGILHRDIKPSNVIFNAFNEPMLGDFGIAAVGGESNVIEAFSKMYAAPEVIKGKTSGNVISEVYSFAKMVSVLLQDLTTPAEISDILNSALAKDPAMRFPTIDTLAKALVPFRS